MKIETAKTLSLGLTVGALLMVFALPYSQAGPGPAIPRVVPVVAQSVIAPTRTRVVQVILASGVVTSVVQAPIDLEPGEVFMLTSMTARNAPSTVQPADPLDPRSDGLRCIRQGMPTGPIVANAKDPMGQTIHQTFPTGIRFTRLPNGRADLFLEGRSYRVPDETRVFSPTDMPDVVLHGYITNDF